MLKSFICSLISWQFQDRHSFSPFSSPLSHSSFSIASLLLLFLPSAFQSMKLSPPLLERGTPISSPALLLCVHPSQTKHYLTVVWVHKDKEGRGRESAIRLLKDREASTNGDIKKIEEYCSIEEAGKGEVEQEALCTCAITLSLLEPVQLLRLRGGSVWVCPARTANNEDRLEWRHTTSSFRPCHRHREMKKWG